MRTLSNPNFEVTIFACNLIFLNTHIKNFMEKLIFCLFNNTVTSEAILLVSILHNFMLIFSGLPEKLPQNPRKSVCYFPAFGIFQAY